MTIPHRSGRHTLVFAVVLLLGVSRLCPAQDASKLDPAKRLAGWRNDLRFLVETLPKKHPNPFTVTPREKFEAAAKDVDARLEGMSDGQIVTELRRLIALVGDAHTMLGDPKGRYPGRAYPFAVVWLADGVFIAATTEKHRDLLGSRLVKIGTTETAVALRRITALIGHENQQWVKHQAPSFLNRADILAALGFVADQEKASVTVSADGKETTAALAPLAKGERLTAFRPKLQELPVTRRGSAVTYGFTMLPNSRDLYVWYHQCQDRKDKTVAAFAKEALGAIDQEQPERIIVDLCRNSGGNSALIRPLVVGLAERKQLQGRVFALISRTTFSSGMWAALEFKNQTKAVLVGEPTGGKPNSFGEGKTFELPNSGLTVFHSTRLWRRVFDGDPESVMPDVAVAVSSKEYFLSRDAMIEAVRNYRGK